ncbi:MAG: choice-of-anchor D domain-containing protein [Spirochaetia bacterium]|nr:choice-of-anchor D domain-containing protein [Spirochaetia bacterium]
MRKAFGLIILILAIGCTEKDLSESLILSYNQKNIPDAGITLSSDETDAGVLGISNIHNKLSAVVRGITCNDRNIVFSTDSDFKSGINFPYAIPSGKSNVSLFVRYVGAPVEKSVDITLTYSYEPSVRIYTKKIVIKLTKTASENFISSGLRIINPVNRTIDFGSVFKGSSATYTIRVANASASSLSVPRIYFTGSQDLRIESQGAFVYQLLNERLELNEIKEYKVYFIPSASKSLEAAQLIFDMGSGKTETVFLNGHGIVSEAPILSVYKDGMLLSNGSSLSFPLTTIGSKSEIVLNLRNESTGRLEISKIALSNPQVFAVDESALSLSGNAAFNLPIRFSPDAEGVSESTMTLATNSADPDNRIFRLLLSGIVLNIDTPTLVLSGAGVSVSSEAGIDYTLSFPNVILNEAVDRTVTFSNLGSVPVIVESLNDLTQDGISVDAGALVGQSLSKGSDISLVFTFLSSTERNVETVLTIVSNSGGNPGSEIKVKVSAVASNILPILPPVVSMKDFVDIGDGKNYSTVQTPFWTFTTAEGSSGSGRFDIRLLQGENEILSQSNTGAEYLCAFNLSDGEYTLEVTEYDTEGNSATSHYPFVVDVTPTVPPVPQISSTIDCVMNPSNNNIYTKSASLYWEWETVSDAGSYRYEIFQSGNPTPLLQQTTTQLNTGTVASSGDGEYIVKVWSIDRFNRESLSYGSASVYVDQTPPVITLNGNLTVSQEVNCNTGTYNDAGISVTDSGAGVEDSGEVQLIWGSSGMCNGRKTGTYTLKYKISDRLGNMAESDDIRTIQIIDTAKPEVTVPSAFIDTGYNVEWASNQNSDALRNILVAQNVNGEQVSVSDLSGDTVANGLTINIKTTANTYKAGRQKIRFTVSDSAGNTSDEKFIAINIQPPGESYYGNLLQNPGFETAETDVIATYAKKYNNESTPTGIFYTVTGWTVMNTKVNTGDSAAQTNIGAYNTALSGSHIRILDDSSSPVNGAVSNFALRGHYDANAWGNTSSSAWINTGNNMSPGRNPGAVILASAKSWSNGSSQALQVPTPHSGLFSLYFARGYNHYTVSSFGKTTNYKIGGIEADVYQDITVHKGIHYQASGWIFFEHRGPAQQAGNASLLYRKNGAEFGEKAVTPYRGSWTRVELDKVIVPANLSDPVTQTWGLLLRKRLSKSSSGRYEEHCAMLADDFVFEAVGYERQPAFESQ